MTVHLAKNPGRRVVTIKRDARGDTVRVTMDGDRLVSVEGIAPPRGRPGRGLQRGKGDHALHVAGGEFAALLRRVNRKSVERTGGRFDE